MGQILFCLFDTEIGHCGLAWSKQGVVRVHFPEGGDSQTRNRLLRGLQAMESGPSPAISRAIQQIQKLLRGEAADFNDIPLDLTGVSEFHRHVYEETCKLGPGQTATYGEIARRVGEPRAAQAIGQALGRNPIPIIIPCHRVLAAGGKMGGFSGAGGIKTKRRLLEIEGALPPEPPSLFDFADSPEQS